MSERDHIGSELVKANKSKTYVLKRRERAQPMMAPQMPVNRNPTDYRGYRFTNEGSIVHHTRTGQPLPISDKQVNWNVTTRIDGIPSFIRAQVSPYHLSPQATQVRYDYDQRDPYVLNRATAQGMPNPGYNQTYSFATRGSPDTLHGESIPRITYGRSNPRTFSGDVLNASSRLPEKALVMASASASACCRISSQQRDQCFSQLFWTTNESNSTVIEDTEVEE
ncbi:MAG: hypothetical protein MJK18_02560 [Bdellovibrionales bacterium]|nr:hypothetical protein [Bdellovibrionales bacterium]